MKKLDIFILRAFAGPFLSSFFISTFFFVLQLFWLFLEEITGKGLDLWDILRFTMYISILSVGNAFPVSILISSIMTFGALSETSEIVGMRSAGLSFARISMPIGFATILLSLIAFSFQNYIIPDSNLKLTSLRYDIISSKPAFSLSEGIFYSELDGFVILVEKKQADNKHIEDIIIYQQSGAPQDYLITAQKGVIEEGKGKQKSLRFILEKGAYYQSPENEDNTSGKQFVQFDFMRYVKDFSLWQFKNQTSDTLFSTSTFTQNISELKTTQKNASRVIANNNQLILDRYANQFPLVHQMLHPSQTPTKTNNHQLLDTMKKIHAGYSNMDENKRNTSIKFTEWLEQSRFWVEENKTAQVNKRQAIVDEQKKYIMSIICFIFFLLGVPLGSMIKKGGLGLPMILAIIIFATFIFSTMFGEKFSKELMGPDPYITPWIGTLFFLVLGVILFVRLWGISLRGKKTKTY